MNVFRLVFFMCFFVMQLACAQTKIFVSEDGNDLSGDGSSENPLKTLGRAADFIISPVDRLYEVRLRGNVYPKAGAVDEVLEWTISGTSVYPITIMSDNANNPAVIQRISSANSTRNTYLLRLMEVSNIIVRDLIFHDAAAGIFVDRARSCKIANCHFIAGYFTPTSGGAPITIGADAYDHESDKFSQAIEVENNTIEFLDHRVLDRCWEDRWGTGPDDRSQAYGTLHHGIYLAHATNCTISGNVIKNAPGAGIHSYHDYTIGNTISDNDIFICYNNPYETLDTKLGTAMGLINNRRQGIMLAGKSNVSGNMVYSNVIHANDHNQNTIYFRLENDGISDRVNYQNKTFEASNNIFYNNSGESKACLADSIIVDAYQLRFQRNYGCEGTGILPSNCAGSDIRIFDLHSADVMLVANMSKGIVWKVERSVGTGANMFDNHILGYQTFNSRITDIEYADGFTFIGFADGRILKIHGTGGTDSDMYGQLTPTSSGFSTASSWYSGSHKFLSGICEISFIEGYLFVSFAGDPATGIAKKILKVNGPGGSGYNLFAINESSIAFSGLSDYDYYVGYDSFLGEVTNMTYNLEELLISFKVRDGIGPYYGKILKIDGVGGSGANMFGVTETTNSFAAYPGFEFFRGCGLFEGYVTKMLADSNLLVCFSSGKVLKVSGNGGGEQNMFAVAEDEAGFSNVPTYTFYIGDTKYPDYPVGYSLPIDNYVTDVVSAGDDTFLALRNGRIYKVPESGTGTGRNLFADIKGYQDFFSTISDLAYVSPYLYVSMMNGIILKLKASAVSSSTTPKAGLFNVVQFPDEIVPNARGEVQLLGWESLDAITQTGRMTDRDIVTSLSEEPMGNEDFQLFPNPSNGEVRVKFANEEARWVQVCDVYGNQVFSAWMDSVENTISLSSHAPGIYLVRIRSKSTNISSRVVIVK